MWLHRGGQVVSFYEADTDAEAEYAEAVVLGEDWDALLERLPKSSPYTAWWETVPCGPTEPVEDVFDRIRDVFAS